MKHRKLRIAWSVAWGLLAVLLVVLWVRSYWWYDCARWRITQAKLIEVTSQLGKLLISDGESPPPIERGYWGQSHKVDPSAPQSRDHRGTLLYSGLGFKRIYWKDGAGIVVPYAFFVLVTMVALCAPWLMNWNRNFSLRTLLIAMTLVAVALGLIVWASR
jgi:hypothetical protein